VHRKKSRLFGYLLKNLQPDMAKTYSLLAALVLENNRVLLRKMVQTDVEWLIPFALHEPATWQFSLVTAAGEAGMRRYVADALTDWEQGRAFPFVVYDKATQSWAGSTRFYDLQPEHSTLQLGYTWYGERFRGTGLNKNCKLLLLEYAFETLAVERVEFRAAHDNARSIAAMKSLGCVEEGILRQQLRYEGGGRRSSMILSILRSEWFATVKPNLYLKTKSLK
jgi:RimJ/RimL family protein N-acetyltransferase